MTGNQFIVESPPRERERKRCPGQMPFALSLGLSLSLSLTRCGRSPIRTGMRASHRPSASARPSLHHVKRPISKDQRPGPAQPRPLSRLLAHVEEGPPSLRGDTIRRDVRGFVYLLMLGELTGQHASSHLFPPKPNSSCCPSDEPHSESKLISFIAKNLSSIPPSRKLPPLPKICGAQRPLSHPFTATVAPGNPWWPGPTVG